MPVQKIARNNAIQAYKVFDKNLQCRGFQFEIGKVFEQLGEIKLCKNGFHACVVAAHCFNYYSFTPENRVCKVLLWGDVDSDEGDKVASGFIEIVEELSWQEVLVVVNSGTGNSGCKNSGNRNSGNQNSGNWNSCDNETGFFNNVESDYLRVFGKECLRDVWDNINKPSWLFFELTEWVPTDSMSNEELVCNPSHVLAGGYLKTLSYKEAFMKSFLKATKEDQAAVRKLPNFDEDIFFDISGIRLSDFGV